MATGTRITCIYDIAHAWNWPAPSGTGPDPDDWGSILGDGITSGWLHNFFNYSGVIASMPAGGALQPTSFIKYTSNKDYLGSSEPVLQVVMLYNTYPQQTDMEVLQGIVNAAAEFSADELGAFDTLGGIVLLDVYIETWSN